MWAIAPSWLTVMPPASRADEEARRPATARRHHAAGHGEREYKRKDIVKTMMELGMCKIAKAYQFVNEAIEQNILESENGVIYRLSPQYCDSNTPL